MFASAIAFFRLLIESERLLHVFLGGVLGKIDFDSGPQLFVNQLVARLKKGERTKSFKLQEGLARIEFNGAVVVRIFFFVVVIELLDEGDALVQIGAPALLAVDSDLEWSFCIRILAEHDEIIAPENARIGHAGIGPDADELGREQGVRIARILRNDGNAADIHDGKSPAGAFDVPKTVIAENVFDTERIFAFRINVDGFGNMRKLFRLGDEGDGAVLHFIDGNLFVVRRISADRVFRRMPETVSAVIDPLVAACFARELRIDHEDILAVFEEAADDAGTDLGRYNQFELAVGEFDAVVPSLELDFFDFHFVFHSESPFGSFDFIVFQTVRSISQPIRSRSKSRSGEFGRDDSAPRAASESS